MNAAIVGCGSVARTHASVLSGMDGVNLVGFADILPDRAKSFANTYGGSCYVSLKDLLGSEKLDVLHICTPHNLHVPMTVLAAECGVAAFCEKPPIIRQDDIETLLAAEKMAPVGICFQNRFNPEIILLRDKVRSGEAGTVKGARAFLTWCRGDAYYAESGGWRGRLDDAGGGVLMNQAVHTLDLLIWLLGRPECVQSSMNNRLLEQETEDTAEVWLRYPDKRAVLYATVAYTADAPVLLEIQCENYTVRAEGNTVTTVWRDGRRETAVFPEQAVTGKDYWGSSHAACIADFYACVREKKPFALSPRNLTDTMDTLMKIYGTDTACR